MNEQSAGSKKSGQIIAVISSLEVVIDCQALCATATPRNVNTKQRSVRKKDLIKAKKIQQTSLVSCLQLFQTNNYPNLIQRPDKISATNKSP